MDAVFPVESDPDELDSPAFFVSFLSELSLDDGVAGVVLDSLLPVSALVLPPLDP